MQAHEERDYYLTLIEISVQELEYADGELHGEVWPSALPRIDGAFVLYDASDRSSFVHVEELICMYLSSLEFDTTYCCVQQMGIVKVEFHTLFLRPNPIFLIEYHRQTP